MAVVTEAIRFLTSVVESGHIRRRALLAISGRLVAKLQQQASTAVLSAAAEFMAAASRCSAFLCPTPLTGLLQAVLCSAMLLDPW